VNTERNAKNSFLKKCQYFSSQEFSSDAPKFIQHINHQSPLRISEYSRKQPDNTFVQVLVSVCMSFDQAGRGLTTSRSLYWTSTLMARRR